MEVLLLFTLIGYYFSSCYSAPQCLDESGRAVDWLTLYKLPRIKGHSNHNINNGTGYLYLTAETVKHGWQLSAFNISDPESIPGKTLNAAYSRIKGNEVADIFWIVYNDQLPLNKSWNPNDGHTKGIVLGNHDGGVWIVHSIPRYPLISDKGYQYPLTGHTYGQSFLCITLNKSELDKIGNQLMVNAVGVYDYKFDGNLQSVYPSLFAAAKKKRNDNVTSKLLFHSAGSVPFTSFAKAKKFNADLYSQWVAEELKSELFVETWLHQDKVPSNCSSPYQTHNIQKINVHPSVCKFGNMKDHSKFAISANSTNPWVCIGDINRATDQFHRAGGTVCFENKDVWKAYIRLVSAVEPCPA